MDNYKISQLANAIADTEGKIESLSDAIQQCWRDGDTVSSVSGYDVFIEHITDPEGDFGTSAVKHMADVLNAATGALAVFLDQEFKKAMDKAAEKKAMQMALAYYNGDSF